MGFFSRFFVNLTLATLMCWSAYAQGADVCIPEADILDVLFIVPYCDISPGKWCGSYNLYCLEVRTRYIGQGIVNPILKTPSNPQGFSLGEPKKLEEIDGKCPGGVYRFSKCIEPAETTEWELLIRVNTKAWINNRTYGREYNLTYGPYLLEPTERPWPDKAVLTPPQKIHYFNWCINKNDKCEAMTQEEFIKKFGYFSFTREYVSCGEIDGKRIGYMCEGQSGGCCPPNELDCMGFQGNLRVCETYTKDIAGGDCEHLRYPFAEFCLNMESATSNDKKTTDGMPSTTQTKTLTITTQISQTTTLTTTTSIPTTTTFPKYDASKNYCGPEGKFSVPSGSLLGTAGFNLACYYHDKCYSECEKPENTQDHCDTQFKQTMDDACNQMLDELLNECDTKSAWNPFKYTCIAIARFKTSACWTQAATYYQTVSIAGKRIGAYPC
jgi:hypothetical protein